MDSQDNAIDIDSELNDWLAKESAAAGVDYADLAKRELDMWRDWKANPTQERFAALYQSHKPVIYKAAQRFLSSTTLPKSAVESNMMKNYIYTLEKFNPDRGAALTTYIATNAGHTGRFTIKYSNIGKIPDKRANLIDLMKTHEANLLEGLGRPATSAELADSMRVAMEDVAELRARGRKLTPKLVGIMRREIRKDLVAELPGGAADNDSGRLADRLVFIHGSLNPDQQLVLEHMFPDWGRPVIEDASELSKVIGLSPQKIRSVRKQIMDKVKGYF